MALGQIAGVVTRESTFSDKVKEALKNAKLGQTVSITWAIPPTVSEKLAPLAKDSAEYSAILLAHAEKTAINGVKVNLTDVEQKDLFEARTLIDQERIDIVRKAMNSERNTHASAAKAFADREMPHVVIKVGTATNVNPDLCRFEFTAYRKLTRTESASAIASRFRKPTAQENPTK